MPDYRCPKHDRIFESLTDIRKPGAQASGNLAAHPVNGHPDCPKCTEEAKETSAPKTVKTAQTATRRIA